MRDTRQRRKPLSIVLLIALLVTLVMPAASLPLTTVQAAPTAPTDDTPTPTGVALVGSLQSEAGCAGDWDPTCAASELLYDAEDGVWQESFELPAGTYEYKVALNDSWDENYGLGGVPGGPNIGLTLATTTTVKFYYSHASHWITSDQTNAIATAPGNLQSELGCNGDWDPSCLRTWLQDLDGDGVYTLETDDLPGGNYEFKVAVNESWDENYGVGGVPNGDNLTFSVASGELVRISWNSTTKVPTVEVLSSIRTEGLGHNSRDSLYRTHYGAAPLGQPVTLRMRTFHNDATMVRLRTYDTAVGAEQLIAMTPVAQNVECFDPALTGETCDFWEATVTPTALGAIYYRFLVYDGPSVIYYEDDAKFDGGWGAPAAVTADRSFNIYAYDPTFETPEWSKNAVIYQIFVERFRNGDEQNDPTDDPATDRGWFYPTERGHRFPIDPWNSIVPDPEPYADTENPWRLTYSSTMFGGDLNGVIEKLDYLQELGVTTLYLNPIFDSPSNHKYDGRNYREVDPAFGGDPAFDALVAELDARGMYLVLDAVPNHVSSDSPYFDRFSRHAEVGACENVSSPYRDWFFFQDVPAGTGSCMRDDGTPLGANYTGWFGVETLPQINTNHPDVLAYWFGTPGGSPDLPVSTATHWMDRGIDGWRVDVVPDVIGVNPTFFETWREVTKAAYPDSVSYSETWSEGDVRDRILGDEFDTTMNYRFRKAVLGFGRDTRWTDNDGGQEVDPLSPSGFVNAFEAIEEDYPLPALQAAMNLIDSHDTNRAVHVLNEAGFTGSGHDRQPVDGFADARDRLKMVAALQLTLPGAPTIYYGDEVGLTGYGFDVNRDDPYNRQPYPWDDEAGYESLPEWRQAHDDMLTHYQTLTGVRNTPEYTFMRTGSFDPLLADDARGLLVYGRMDANGAAIVALNQLTETQTFTVDLSTYIPDATVLDQVAPITGTATPATTVYTLTVGPRGYGIWVTPDGTDMSPPAAPANLTVSGVTSATVELTWDAVADADGYRVFRSPVSGGGFVQVGETDSATLSFVDTTVAPATRYFYVVAAVRDGLEGAFSNEVSALPAYVINWANTQFPPTLAHTISTITPTESIYGQVFIDGVTAQAGATPTLIAEVGYGPDATLPEADPDAWTWFPTEFNGQSGNNDEFVGALLPDAVGSFDYAYRYSTNNGVDWLYADLDGTGNGYDPAQAGTLTVNASSDTTAPEVPLNLRELRRSAAMIAVTWDAVPDVDIDRYEVFRDGEFLASVMAPTTAFTDENVVVNTTYTYTVRAVDTSFNRSAFSNEVEITAEVRMVEVTFRVRVPAETPEGDLVYIAGNNAEVFGAQWNPGATPMTEVAEDVWEYTATAPEGTALEYKYTRGAWERVEWWGSIVSVANRSTSVLFGLDGTFVVDNTATDWGNGEDDTKAVEAWRDPLIAAFSPEHGAILENTPAISATWSRPVTPTTSADVVLTVRSQYGNVVPGTVIFVSPTTAQWVPMAPLAGGTYTVTALNVRRDDIGEPVPMQAAVQWSFTIEGGQLYLPMVAKP